MTSLNDYVSGCTQVDVFQILNMLVDDAYQERAHYRRWSGRRRPEPRFSDSEVKSRGTAYRDLLQWQQETEAILPAPFPSHPVFHLLE